MFFQTKISYFVGKGYYRRDGRVAPEEQLRIQTGFLCEIEFGYGRLL